MQSVVLKVLDQDHSIDLSQLSLRQEIKENLSQVTLRCPYCGVVGVPLARAGGVFQQIVQTHHDHRIGVNLWFGVRSCSNPACAAPIFIIAQHDRVVASLPPETIDFDASSVPEKVAASLTEAITCHAHSCHRGAALLVRRTLEELCEDRGASGKDLKARIASLAGLITLPQALISAMDSLRLLGNDAAHIEAKTYDNLGEEEVSVAIELCKEIVKATYQYDGLLGRLQKLGRTKP